MKVHGSVPSLVIFLTANCLRSPSKYCSAWESELTIDFSRAFCQHVAKLTVQFPKNAFWN